MFVNCRSALMLAYESDSVETVEALLGGGADTQLVDALGHKATDYSVTTGNRRIVQMFQDGVLQGTVRSYYKSSLVSSVNSSEISETAHDHTTNGRNNPHTIRPSVWLLFMAVPSQEIIVIQGSGSRRQLGAIEMKGLFPTKDIAHVLKTDV